MVFDKKEVAEKIHTYKGEAIIYSLPRLEELGYTKLSRLPYSIRILLENQVRHHDGYIVREEDVEAVAKWEPTGKRKEIPFMPSRVVLQDFTGVPAVVDLAAMRDAMKELGGDPSWVNPLIPADLIIDHSVQVDYFGTVYSLFKNLDMEYRRNRERYTLLKWAQQAFSNFRVVPPGKGIIHQVNLEYLAQVVHLRETGEGLAAFPDTLIGTDSHTVMINGLGVLGWGVGGIEAEAVMLGQPYYMLIPDVVGVKLVGELPEGATATDLVLTVTELLRKEGVVGKFVEFFGPGVKKLALPDRATVANMAPEYGATMGFFPPDEVTLKYLELTGRPVEHVKFVEEYLKRQKLFYTLDEPEPVYTKVIVLDMSTIEPSIAGPRQPDERIPLKKAKETVEQHIREFLERRREIRTSIGGSELHDEGAPHHEVGEEDLHKPEVEVTVHGEKSKMTHGSTVIAAITSCTNTSNPSVLIGAGLLAKKAVELGLKTPAHVKTSLAPGSRVVVDYLREAGLLPYLEALRFHVVGFGCTTCIGNSGPLPEPVSKAIQQYDLYAAAVLSGNRNFEGRIHPLSRGNYLASPILVVAYALAGRMDIDFEKEPIQYDPNGNPVYLRDIWPSQKEIKEYIEKSIKPEMFKEKYSNVFEGDERWKTLEAPSGTLFHWDPSSTYIRKPPFFENMPLEPPEPKDIRGARVLMLLGDKVTTDHISPAGAIPKDSPAGKYLIEHGVKPYEFNTYGSRRGNHEVMMRGTFANIRIRNLLVPDLEGGWTKHFPDGEVMTVYDAAMKYKEEGVPVIVIAGKQYGTGSSRDWAAKGPYLLGVKAVIAESFERIHRSNLVGMGILPLEFMPGENAKTLGLTGEEVYDIIGIKEGLEPGKILTVRATKPDGSVIEFKVKARLDTHIEVEYYKHGGILQYVLRKILKEHRD